MERPEYHRITNAQGLASDCSQSYVPSFKSYALTQPKAGGDQKLFASNSFLKSKSATDSKLSLQREGLFF